MKKILATGIAMLLFLTGSAVLFAGGQGEAEEANEFIIFHYWTAGGEKEAIN